MRFIIYGNISNVESFVRFGMGSRLIRINRRSAAGDPLEEFPKGNSLRRLQGASVSALVARPRNYMSRALAFFEPPGFEAASTDRRGKRWFPQAARSCFAPLPRFNPLPAPEMRCSPAH
jgi:hypothetical protein